jgi:hypothetical protein
LRAAPLPGALALAALGAVPFAAWRAGRALAAALEPLLDDPRLARLLTIAPVVAGATVGAAACVTTAGRRALGPQLAALPVGARAALAATALVPASAALALGLPAALALAVSFGAASPGGPVAGLGLVAAGVAGAAAGAATAESLLQARAGARLRSSVSLLCLGTAWSGAGALLGSTLLGPVAHVGPALTGRSDALPALVEVVLAAVVGGAVWLELAVRRPEWTTAARPSRYRLVRGPLALALPLAAAILLVRRRDVRLAALAAVGFGLGGVVIAVRAGVPAPGPLHLGASSTLLGVALAPLAVGGIASSGRWAWVCAPRARVLPCAALALAAHAVVLAALLPVLGASELLSEAPSRPVGQAGFVTLGLAAAALLAGGLAPWRAATAGDQFASFATFAVCAGLVSAATGVAGPRLVAAGLSDAAAAAGLLAVWAVVSLGAVVRLLLEEA